MTIIVFFQKLRWQIYFLYHYLSTCKLYDIKELSRDVWPRVYFFNNIHLYSFAVSACWV